MKNSLILIIVFISTLCFAKDLGQFSCGGSEPNWALKINNKELNYDSPDASIHGIKVIKSSVTAKVIKIAAKAPKGEKVRVEMTSDKNCTDGTSENISTHKIDWWINKDKKSGCCEPSKPISKEK